VFGNDGNLTLPAGGDILDSTGTSVLGGAGGNPFDQDLNTTDSVTFANVQVDGNVALGLVSRINSGGFGVTNSAEFGTDVTLTGPTITGSEIFMGAGTAESRAIVNSDGNSLIYTGVENPGFAGMVAIDPGVTNDYAIQVGANNHIEIGAVAGTITTTEYVVGLGVINNTGNINGIFANANVAVIGVGDIGWKFDDNGTLYLPGDDQVSKITFSEAQGAYINQGMGEIDIRTGPGADLQIQSDGGNNTWYFGYDGIATFPGAINQNLITTKGGEYLSIPDSTTSDIWTAHSLHITSVKLTVQIESRTSNPDYDNFDTMTCEIVMSKKRVGGTYTAAPITVYGIVHTSADPLATFGSYIITTPGPDLGKAVLTCTPDASITDTCYVRVQSVEMFSPSVQNDF
jgi:hypothetical protein